MRTNRFYMLCTAALLSATAGLALTGCMTAGHGEYTSQHMDNAKLRAAQMKAATAFDMARQQFLVGDLRKAMGSISESIGYKNDVPKTHTLRGRILVELGQLEQALVSFDRALEIDAIYVDAHYFKGIVFERFSEFQQGYDCYRTAAGLDASNPQYLIASAEMLIELGRLGEARKHLETKLPTFPHNAGVKQTLGHIAFMQGRTSHAVELFRDARTLASEDFSILEDLALAEAAEQNWSEVEYITSRLLKVECNKERRDLRHLHAQALVELDQLVEARAELLALSNDEHGSRDVSVWIDLGKVALAVGDAKRARIAAGRLVRLAPDRYEGYALAAAILIERGEFEKSLVELDKAIDRTEHNPEPALLKGAILSRLGRQDEAEACFTLAAEIDPTNVRVQQIVTAPEE